MTDTYQSQLPSEIVSRIKDLCGKGYTLYDKKDFEGALRTFYQAWILLPKPQNEHLEAGWVLTALGDTYFRACKYPQALEAISSALYCPHGEQNIFAQFRKGQVLLELGDTASARLLLHKAHIAKGDALFADEAPKYLDSISDLIIG